MTSLYLLFNKVPLMIMKGDCQHVDQPTVPACASPDVLPLSLSLGLLGLIGHTGRRCPQGR